MEIMDIGGDGDPAAKPPAAEPKVPTPFQLRKEYQATREFTYGENRVKAVVPRPRDDGPHRTERFRLQHNSSRGVAPCEHPRLKGARS